MDKFECPLKDKSKCPEHELFHYAVNRVQVENAEHLLKIKELEVQLETAYDEIKTVIEAMKNMISKPLISKGNKNECKNAGVGSVSDVDAQCG